MHKQTGKDPSRGPLSSCKTTAVDPGRFGHHLLVGGETAGAVWWGLTQLPDAPGSRMVKLAQTPHVECRVKLKSGVRDTKMPGWRSRSMQGSSSVKKSSQVVPEEGLTQIHCGVCGSLSWSWSGLRIVHLWERTRGSFIFPKLIHRWKGPNCCPSNRRS